MNRVCVLIGSNLAVACGQGMRFLVHYVKLVDTSCRHGFTVTRHMPLCALTKGSHPSSWPELLSCSYRYGHQSDVMWLASQHQP